MVTEDGRLRLVGFSRNVLYDFEMVEALAKRLTDIAGRAAQPAWKGRMRTTDADLRPAQFVVNAMIESFGIRARTLVEFLNSTDSAVSAADYFDGGWSEWGALRRSLGRWPDALRDENLSERVGAEVAHLGEVRATFIEGGGMWDQFGIYSALSKVMQVFAVHVLPDRVVDDFNARVMEAGTDAERHRAGLRINASDTAGLAFPVATQGLRPR